MQLESMGDSSLHALFGLKKTAAAGHAAWDPGPQGNSGGKEQQGTKECLRHEFVHVRPSAGRVLHGVCRSKVPVSKAALVRALHEGETKGLRMEPQDTCGLYT